MEKSDQISDKTMSDRYLEAAIEDAQFLLAYASSNLPMDVDEKMLKSLLNVTERVRRGERMSAKQEAEFWIAYQELSRAVQVGASATPPEKQYDVFVSHSREERDWVEMQLAERLKSQGLSVCFEIYPPKPDPSLPSWRENMAASRLVLAVFCESYFKGGLARVELETAIRLSEKKQVEVYAVMIESGISVPSLYKDIRCFDFSPHYSGKAVPEQTEAAWESLLQEITVIIAPPIKSRALADTYSEQDLLGYQDYVEALARFIESAETKKPITIGIDAPWGGGKTTIMHLLEKRLGPQKRLRIWQRRNWDGQVEGSLKILLQNAGSGLKQGWQKLLHPRSWTWPWANQGKGHLYTVWFNAWQYDQEESLWAALVLQILEQVRKQMSLRRRLALSLKLNWGRFRVEEFILDFLKALLLVVILLLIGAAISAGLASLSGGRFQIPSRQELIGEMVWIEALGLLSLIPLAYTILKDVFGRIVSPFRLGISRYMKRPDYESKVGFLGQFQADYKAVVESVTEKGIWPLLIFIDDLDRCNTDKVAAVIESINLLLNSEHCVFVIGMDSKILASSIQAKHRDLQEFFRDPDNPGGLSLGHKFLEKIIQIDFRVPLPAPDKINNFIDFSLGGKIASPPVMSPVDEQVSLLSAEMRGGKSMQEAMKTVTQKNPEFSSASVLKAAAEIEATSFDKNPVVQRTVREMAPLLDYNPRKIKRYINLYRLQALIAQSRGVLNRSVSLDTLGKWTLIALRWPEFFDESLEHHNTPANFLELASKLSTADTAEMRKSILENIASTSLRQDRIRLLLDNPELVGILSRIDLDKVGDYLQLVKLGAPSPESGHAT